MDKRNLDKTRQALIDSAESLMAESDTPEKVTSRAIAQKAGVNLAMINYCFGSRENLLYTVFRRIIVKAQSAQPKMIKILSSDMPPAEKLYNVHLGMMKLMLSHFSYAQAITRFIIMNRSLDSDLDSFELVRQHFNGIKSDEECRLITFQLTSLNELAVLRFTDLRVSCGIDLTDDDQLSAYLRNNINRFLEL